MKPDFIPHRLYQDFEVEQLQTHYTGGILVITNNQWALISKLWITDFSRMTTMLRPLYDDKGPKPRDPASMLRSYLLNLLIRPQLSVTKWVDEMHTVPLYAILSGFEPGDIPGVGTFYDFFRRLWAAERKHYTPKRKSAARKRKPKKGKKGEKAPTATPGRVKRMVEWILPRLDQKKPLPSDRLFDFFQSQILAVSANLGLLGDMSRLNAAGDGTPVVTSARPRSKPLVHAPQGRTQNITRTNLHTSCITRFKKYPSKIGIVCLFSKMVFNIQFFQPISPIFQQTRPFQPK
ncbi:hypothetical protein [Paenibacillus sp. MBLB4367]|uniref:hypothetical protein n=1 Tax=Paenibacillus sp. MBLB4367 TaxID=3384767 RepID=UPI003907FB90